METVWRQCLVGSGKMIGNWKNSGFRDAKYKLNRRQRGHIARDFTTISGCVG
jgi:hypothetical protein